MLLLMLLLILLLSPLLVLCFFTFSSTSILLNLALLVICLCWFCMTNLVSGYDLYSLLWSSNSRNNSYNGCIVYEYLGYEYFIVSNLESYCCILLNWDLNVMRLWDLHNVMMMWFINFINFYSKVLYLSYSLRLLNPEYIDIPN